MVIRACVYKGCENYVMNNVMCGNKPFSMFMFPKKPERRKQWMALGQVPSKIPESHLYFCSEHFDKKYWSVSQKRTVLVGAALPFQYKDATNHDETATTTEASEEEVLNTQSMKNSPIYEENSFLTLSRLEEEVESTEVLEIVDDDEYQVESTTMHDDGDEERQAEIEEGEEQEATDEEELVQEGILIECDDDETVGNAMTEAVTCKILPVKVQKRKLMEIEDAAAPVKTKVLLNKVNVTPHSRVSSQEVGTKVHKASTPQKTEYTRSKEPLVDDQNVTTFIFKGEEYVQMSKEYYEQEKLQLLQKLKQYEKVLRCCKQELNTLNLS